MLIVIDASIVYASRISATKPRSVREEATTMVVDRCSGLNLLAWLSPLQQRIVISCQG